MDKSKARDPHLVPHTVSGFLHKISPLGCIIRLTRVKFRRGHMEEYVIIGLLLLLIHGDNIAVPPANLVIKVGLTGWQVTVKLVEPAQALIRAAKEKIKTDASAFQNLDQPNRLCSSQRLDLREQVLIVTTDTYQETFLGFLIPAVHLDRIVQRIFLRVKLIGR